MRRTEIEQSRPQMGYTAAEIARAYSLVWSMDARKGRGKPKELPVYGGALEERQRPRTNG